MILRSDLTVRYPKLDSYLREALPNLLTDHRGIWVVKCLILNTPSNTNVDDGLRANQQPFVQLSHVWDFVPPATITVTPDTAADFESGRPGTVRNHGGHKVYLVGVQLLLGLIDWARYQSDPDSYDGPDFDVYDSFLDMAYGRKFNDLMHTFGRGRN
jgi:hypothetical protein